MYYIDVCISEHMYISMSSLGSIPLTRLGSKSVGSARPAAGQYLWQASSSACSLFPVGIWPLMILLDAQVCHHDKETPIHLLIAGLLSVRIGSYPLISDLYQFRGSF